MSEGNGNGEQTQPVISRREEITKAMQAEMTERAQRCMQRISVILDEEKCILTAMPMLEEVQPARFLIKCEPGIKAL